MHNKFFLVLFVLITTNIFSTTLIDFNQSNSIITQTDGISVLTPYITNNNGDSILTIKYNINKINGWCLLTINLQNGVELTNYKGLTFRMKPDYSYRDFKVRLKETYSSEVWEFPKINFSSNRWNTYTLYFEELSLTSESIQIDNKFSEDISSIQMVITGNNEYDTRYIFIKDFLLVTREKYSIISTDIISKLTFNTDKIIYENEKELEISFKLNEDAYVKLYIFNLAGIEKYSASTNNIVFNKDVDNIITWSGNNNSNQNLKTGLYILLLKTVTLNNKESIYKNVIQISK